MVHTRFWTAAGEANGRAAGIAIQILNFRILLGKDSSTIARIPRAGDQLLAINWDPFDPKKIRKS